MSTYRIMAVQEEGSEVCLADRVKADDVERRIDRYHDDYPEYRDIFCEQEESVNFGFYN